VDDRSAIADTPRWYDGDPLDLLLVEDFDQRRPAWHAHAACRGMGPELFFTERGEDVRPAKAICSGCPVAVPCGAAAGEHGIWAGTSARERNQARRAA
jgi:WhiB family redox-sensing transcriptional regulator